MGATYYSFISMLANAAFLRLSAPGIAARWYALVVIAFLCANCAYDYWSSKGAPQTRFAGAISRVIGLWVIFALHLVYACRPDLLLMKSPHAKAVCYASLDR